MLPCLTPNSKRPTARSTTKSYWTTAAGGVTSDSLTEQSIIILCQGGQRNQSSSSVPEILSFHKDAVVHVVLHETNIVHSPVAAWWCHCPRVQPNGAPHLPPPAETHSLHTRGTFVSGLCALRRRTVVAITPRAKLNCAAHALGYTGREALRGGLT